MSTKVLKGKTLFEARYGRKPSMEHCSSENQIADIMTEGLYKIKFEVLRRSIQEKFEGKALGNENFLDIMFCL